MNTLLNLTPTGHARISAGGAGRKACLYRDVSTSLPTATPIAVYSLGLTRYAFFPGVAPAGLGGAAEKDDTGTAGFFACFGFFFSRLLRCWPLAMAILLNEGGWRDAPTAIRCRGWGGTGGG